MLGTVVHLTLMRLNETPLACFCAALPPWSCESDFARGSSGLRRMSLTGAPLFPMAAAAVAAITASAACFFSFSACTEARRTFGTALSAARMKTVARCSFPPGASGGAVATAWRSNGNAAIYDGKKGAVQWREGNGVCCAARDTSFYRLRVLIRIGCRHLPQLFSRNCTCVAYTQVQA